MEQHETHTCAVHDIVMDTLNARISDLQANQKEIQALLIRNHEDIINLLMERTKYNKAEINALKADFEKDFTIERAKWEKRFEKLECVVDKIRYKFLKMIFAGLGGVTAISVVMTHWDKIARIFGS